MRVGARAQVGAWSAIGADSVIGREAWIGERVRLGRGVRVDPGAVVADGSVVLEGSHVRAERPRPQERGDSGELELRSFLERRALGLETLLEEDEVEEAPDPGGVRAWMRRLLARRD